MTIAYSAELSAALTDVGEVLEPLAGTLLQLNQAWERTTLAVYSAADESECYASALDGLCEIARLVRACDRLVRDGRADLDLIAGGDVR